MPTTEASEVAQITGTDGSQVSPQARDLASTIVNTEAKPLDGSAVPPETSPSADDAAAAEKAAKAAEADARKKAADRKVFAEIRARRSAAERLKLERSQIEVERNQIRNELGQFRSQLQAAKDDPIGFLETHGYTPEQLAERVLRRGEELSPEQQASAIAREAKAEAQALRKELERRDNEQAARSNAANLARWESEFTTAMLDEGKFPNIVQLWSKSEVLEETKKLAHEVLERGLAQGHSRERLQRELDELPNDEVGKLLDRRAGKKLEAIEAKILARKEKERAKEAEKAATPPNAIAATTKTLTNTAASEKARGAVALDRLPEREQNRILAEQMRQIIAGRK